MLCFRAVMDVWSATRQVDAYGNGSVDAANNSMELSNAIDSRSVVGAGWSFVLLNGIASVNDD
jgi:hypothetical protein